MTAAQTTNQAVLPGSTPSGCTGALATSMAAFVVTFRRPGVLAETLKCILGQTRVPELIAVIDNGGDARTEQAVRELGDPRLEYHRMSDNLGPAGGACFGLQYLASRGFPWIYWGDDDDPPPDRTTLEQLLEVAVHYPGRLGAVGVVGALFNRWRGRLERLRDDQLDGLCQVDVIGGGQQMLVSGEAVRASLLPRTELFFGFEELSFHLALRDAGYDVVVPGAMMLEMRRRAGHLGMPHDARMGQLAPAGAVWREYYSTRNMFYLLFHCSKHRWGAVNFAFRRLGKAVLGFRAGPRYGGRLAGMVFCGLRDGLLGKMGRRDRPPTSR